MEPVSLTLTQKQFETLLQGKAAQLSKRALEGVKHTLHVPTHIAGKINKAKRAGKGIRIAIHPSHLGSVESGEGLKELWQGVKKGASWLKQHIIDTPAYQKYVRPIVKELVDKGVNMVPAGPLRDLAQKGQNYLSQKTGAFGLPHDRVHHVVHHHVLSDGYQRQIGSMHPAMWPVEPYLQPVGEIPEDVIEKKGGSFRR